MNTKIILTRAGAAPLLNVLGVGVQILADESDTGKLGVIALCTCEPGSGAPLHEHEQAECFFVVEGTLSLFDGKHWFSASVGDTVKVPAGSMHAFRNESTDTARFLTISMPAAHARFFREADELGKSGTLDPVSIVGLCGRNGIAIVDR